LNTLPLGGRNLTRDIMTGLNKLEETCESVKKNINNPLDPSHVSSVTIEDIPAREAANYISARTGEIIANINQQLADAGVSADSIQSIVLIGGGAHLGGLQQKLEETIKIKVRMGQNPVTLNILNNEINRLEYIEVFSLLAKAADMIPVGETCIELNKYEDGPVLEGSNYPQREEPTQPRKPEKTKEPKEPKSRKPWSKWTEKLKGLMTEDDDEEQ
jgi:cell division ATPase FtsA